MTKQVTTKKNNKKTIIVIVSPTATAKTRIAKLLANKINGAIINCDAFQIYKELNIGVNKSNFNNFYQPQYLFDIKHVDEEYSIQQFQKDARAAIDDCFKKNILPILVGGSVLYILSCLKDFQYSKQRSIDNTYDSFSNNELHELLQKIDIEESKKVHANNRVRVIRALQVFKNEGINKTNFNKSQSREYIYDNVLIFSPTVERQELYNIIDSRVDKQFNSGLLEEATKLSTKYSKELPALQAIGYKEINYGLEKNQSLEEIKILIKQHSRNYAKKQITFLKKFLKITFLPLNFNDLNTLVSIIITDLNKNLQIIKNNKK